VVKSRSILLAVALSTAVVPPIWAGSGARILIELGISQANEGRLDEALTTLQRAVAENPGSSLAYTRLGGVQLLKQEYSSGIESFQQAILLDQGNANAFVGMGVAYLHLGQYALAREALSEAEKLAPSKKAEIGRVRAWIDSRSTAGTH
jgi:Flp pilus assembly protein TadD